MDKYHQLRRHGLFDAKVPRYTSYPPANHFEGRTGLANQDAWLAAVPAGEAVSLYLHIPFCKRLCWFCACRTQGTQTLEPVAAYIDTLITEIERVRAALPADIRMARLHLGGGTPTILTSDLMSRLMDAIYAHFIPSEDYEFSVEIDPTEAAPELIETLGRYGMNRASIGVQDFNPVVQEAIGRPQTYAQTHAVVDALRAAKVHSLNMDLLYGLPHQTRESLSDTLQKVMALHPDRIALYGYAHVPWMSKRQKMIDDSALPGPETRFALTELARTQLNADGFVEIGIDHFARPDDSLTVASKTGRLRRNFQGYTDDDAACLIGLGASAISRFPQGYVQNVSATSLYHKAIREGGLAGGRGFALAPVDCLVADMIENLMCRFAIDAPALTSAHPSVAARIGPALDDLAAAFSDVVQWDGTRLVILPAGRPLVRIISASLDRYRSHIQAHSAAV